MSQPLQVIGAGFGRTGTKSLQTALEILDLGPCYHMSELMKHNHHVEVFEPLLEGKHANLDDALAGYRSAVDFPCCLYYQELLAAYPNAKVVLTERDPESWYQSASSTYLKVDPPLLVKAAMTIVAKFSKKVRGFWYFGRYNHKMLDQVMHGDRKSKEKCIAAYKEHVAKVKATVPADKLLCFSVKDGWEPLCEFLGVPVPDQPFPRSNDKDEFEETFAKPFTKLGGGRKKAA